MSQTWLPKRTGEEVRGGRVRVTEEIVAFLYYCKLYRSMAI
jgi:hypothetical protein